MKKGRLVILLIAVAVCGMTVADAQSKKEQIGLLTRKTDSLQRALAAKNESLIQLQVKLARIEGVTDAHNEEIKRLESKSDSLKDLLLARNATIEGQTAKITQLTSDLTGLQSQQKEWTSKNEALSQELANLKQKPDDAAVAAKDTKQADVSAATKDTKQADPPKPEIKTGTAVLGNKPDAVVKNQPDQ